MNQIDVLNKTYEEYKVRIDRVYGDKNLTLEQKQKEYSRIIHEFEGKTKKIVEGEA
ncbi:hypothetical protein HY570_00585 [Candidatus Micrarchaeota archaeon]|nr:hypothetical protein [Candidatus Micrarchaeota archaeon]